MFLEQPLGHHDLKGLAALARASPIPLGADEGIHSLADITAHARAGAGGVSLKLIKLGGMSAAAAAAHACERLGLAVNVAAKIAESGVASAPARHPPRPGPEGGLGGSPPPLYLPPHFRK